MSPRRPAPLPVLPVPPDDVIPEPDEISHDVITPVSVSSSAIHANLTKGRIFGTGIVVGSLIIVASAGYFTYQHFFAPDSTEQPAATTESPDNGNTSENNQQQPVITTEPPSDIVKSFIIAFKNNDKTAVDGLVSQILLKKYSEILGSPVTSFYDLCVQGSESCSAIIIGLDPATVPATHGDETVENIAMKVVTVPGQGTIVYKFGVVAENGAGKIARFETVDTSIPAN